MVVGRIRKLITLVQEPPETSHVESIIPLQKIGPELIYHHENRERGGVHRRVCRGLLASRRHPNKQESDHSFNEAHVSPNNCVTDNSATRLRWPP